MAKTRGTHFFNMSHSARIKKIPSKITVSAQANRGAKAFHACADVGNSAQAFTRSRSYNTRRVTQACAFGKNPREAIARALTKTARTVRRRAGAFAGLSGMRTTRKK